MKSDNCAEILSQLEYKEDIRKKPNSHRRQQFLLGWEEATISQKTYSKSTLKRLTWRNLGYRIGQRFGQRSLEKINQTFDRFAEYYQVNMGVSQSQIQSELQYNSGSREKLLKVIQQAPSRKWMDEYFSLVKELIEFTKVDNDDPRLVLSLPQSRNFPVTINGRHVLSGFRRSKPLVGFIVSSNCEDLSGLLSVAVSPEFLSHQYQAYAGELQNQAPYFLCLEGSPQTLLTEEQRTVWKQATLVELNRFEKSPYKKHHQPIVYKAVVDLDYRNSLLDEVFPKEFLGQPHNKSPSFDNLLDDINVTVQIQENGDFSVEEIEDERQRKQASIVQRQGQSDFRHKLLIAYKGRCLITGCKVEETIEAAHIIPYQGVATNNLTNGLTLRADVHKLFDLYLLSVNPENYEVLVSPRLAETYYEQFAYQKLHLPKDSKILPSKEALIKHYEIFLKKQNGKHI